jgi:hypothetical protein
LGTVAEPDYSVPISGERSDINGSWGGNRFPAIIVEHEDSVFAPKKNATLRILCYCKYLAQPLTIVVSGESSKKRMPKLSFAGKDDAGAADRNNERKEIDHLKKQSIQLVTGTNCNRTVVSH